MNSINDMIGRMHILVIIYSWFFSLFGCSSSSIETSGQITVREWNVEATSFPETLTFGIVPQQTPTDIETNWGALVQFLEKETGYTIHIKTASSIPIFEQRCSEGRYDFAYMNPYHYVIYSKNPGYKALVRQKDKQIQGIIVTKKEDKDNDLNSFSGKELAFPAPAAFAASLLTRAHLTAENIPFDPIYVRTHDSVYQAVADGLFPAGGGVKRTFFATAPEIREKLAITWTTERFTPHAIAIHPRVTPEIADKLEQAFIQLDDQITHQDILAPIHFNGFEKANDTDWNDVRSLNLTSLLAGQ